MNSEFTISIDDYEEVVPLRKPYSTYFKSKSKDREEHYIKIVGSDYDDCNFDIYEVDSSGKEITFIGTGYTTNQKEYIVEFKYYQT